MSHRDNPSGLHPPGTHLQGALEVAQRLALTTQPGNGASEAYFLLQILGSQPHAGRFETLAKSGQLLTSLSLSNRPGGSQRAADSPQVQV